MTRRMTVTIADDVTDDEALAYIRNVIAEGRISNDGTQYCYHVSFKDGGQVSSFLTRTGNDSFSVYRQEDR